MSLLFTLLSLCLSTMFSVCAMEGEHADSDFIATSMKELRLFDNTFNFQCSDDKQVNVPRHSVLVYPQLAQSIEQLADTSPSNIPIDSNIFKELITLAGKAYDQAQGMTQEDKITNAQTILCNPELLNKLDINWSLLLEGTKHRQETFQALTHLFPCDTDDGKALRKAVGNAFLGMLQLPNSEVFLDTFLKKLMKYDSGNMLKGRAAYLLEDCHTIKTAIAKTIAIEEKERVLKRDQSVFSVTFSPDGKSYASGSADGTVKIWNLETGACINTLKGHTDGVKSIAFGHKCLASGSYDGTIKIWDVMTGECTKTLRGLGRNGFFESVALSPCGGYLASGSNENTVQIWDIATGTCIKTLKGHIDWVRSVAFSPCGGYLVSGAVGHIIKIWNLHIDECVNTFEADSIDVTSVAFSPCGQYFASGSDGSLVEIHDFKTGKCIRTLQSAKPYCVRSVVFSPCGQYLASGSDDKTVRIWYVPTGEHINTLHGHSDVVKSVAFSPCGQYVASGSYDKTIKIWDVSELTSIDHILRALPYEAQLLLLVFEKSNGSMILTPKELEILNTFPEHLQAVLSSIGMQRP